MEKEFEKFKEMLIKRDQVREDVTRIANTQLKYFEDMLKEQQKQLEELGEMHDELETITGKELLEGISNQMYTLVGQIENVIKNMEEVKEEYGKL